METERKRARKRELNIRERKLLSALLEGKSSALAAREAGYAPSRATKTASEKLTRPGMFRDTFRARVSELGLDDTELALRLLEGLVSSLYGLSPDGTVIELGPDAHARARYLDLALKVYGAYERFPAGIAAASSAEVVILP